MTPPRGRDRGHRHGHGEPGREAGAATVLVMAAAAMTLAVGLATGLVARVVQAGARARTAADLAALAGADALGAGADACAAAAVVARANDARLVTCDAGPSVTVVVEVPGPALVGQARRARARAEPGIPVTAPPQLRPGGARNHTWGRPVRERLRRWTYAAELLRR